MTPREKILKYMKEHRLKATDFADKTDVPKGRLSDYLKHPDEYAKIGKESPQVSINYGRQICQALGWTLDYFYEGKTYPPAAGGKADPGVRLTNAEKLVLEVARRVSPGDPDLTEAVDRLYGVQRRRAVDDLIPDGDTWKQIKDAEPPRKRKNGPA